MADDTLSTLRDTIQKQTDTAADALRNNQLQRPFFSEQDSDEAVDQLFDRSDIQEQLKGLLPKEHTMAQWVELKAQMDYLAGLERDVKMQYRKSRIDCYRDASLQKKFIGLGVQYFSDRIDAVKSQQSS